ncbi:iron uptake transporter permease EfeU [Arthrobacter sp. 35W]|uniref:iron uptake transporter permease EfeU n=1 Tax=Arthrobacter sp. 35W TaxID=1132441 RepID=UPI0009DED941|nr:iron uptake transporter permease EfeU [Arthrobacter sp. 35W]
MLATLVIGLREGLEAALIVGMIAAFLRRNGASLAPMWIGVGAAAVLSAVVGLVLELVSAALPQAQQEGMESIIGLVAVGIVTFMIVWMAKNARSMKSEVESHAANALGGGSALALASMAFLAVLREGIETAVFLVAAFQSSVDPMLAGAGAVLGLVLAAAAGYGLYRGGIKLNLAKFFKATGVFLAFVAAGLVMKSLRTAHEAGWITLGQGATVDLSWLAPNGSWQAALLTGVLGIPSDPRVIEVLGWLLYLLPVLYFILAPRGWRPSPANAQRAKFATAGALAGAAAVLAIAAPLLAPQPAVAGTATGTGTTAVVDDAGKSYGTLSLDRGTLQLSLDTAGRTTTFDLAAADHHTVGHLGTTATEYSLPVQQTDSGPASLDRTALAALNGGRLPVGIGGQNNPGPFDAAWSHDMKLTVWLAGTELLDAASAGSTTATLSGGGLPTARTVVLPSPDAWTVPAASSAAAAQALALSAGVRNELPLWHLWLPAVLAAAALLFAAVAFRQGRRPAPHTASAPSASHARSGRTPIAASDNRSLSSQQVKDLS